VPGGPDQRSSATTAAATAAATAPAAVTATVAPTVAAGVGGTEVTELAGGLLVPGRLEGDALALAAARAALVRTTGRRGVARLTREGEGELAGVVDVVDPDLDLVTEVALESFGHELYDAGPIGQKHFGFHPSAAYAQVAARFERDGRIREVSLNVTKVTAAGTRRGKPYFKIAKRG
jgi:hypothetical protein